VRVVLIPSNIDGSGCYRNLLPARELRLQRGWDAHMAPHRIKADGRHRLIEFTDDGRGIDTWLLEQDFDALVWQQRGEPWTAGLTGKLRAQGKRVLVDSDDAWWGLPDWNPGSRRPKAEVGSMRRQLSAAHGLSVATPALAELYERYNTNIRVIRNYLDWHMWEDVTPAYELERRHVRIGWMGEVLWREGDLGVLRGFLAGWLERHPEVEFVCAGDPRAHDILRTPPARRVTTGQVEFYNFDLADITATFDIGLVPLKVDDPKSALLNECKSHLKGLEYAACGIPCIATPTESYRHWVREGVNGFLASTPEEWINALEWMLVNWRMYGARARAMAAEHTLQNPNRLSEWEGWIAGSGSHTEPPRPRAAVAAGVGVS
jgi:hypothetical protein